jgi:hypothetical protein
MDEKPFLITHCDVMAADGEVTDEKVTLAIQGVRHSGNLDVLSGGQTFFHVGAEVRT